MVDLKRFVYRGLYVTGGKSALGSNRIVIIRLSSLMVESTGPCLTAPKTAIRKRCKRVLSRKSALIAFVCRGSESNSVARNLPGMRRILRMHSVSSVSVGLRGEISN